MYTHLPPCIYTKNRFFVCEKGHFLHLWGPKGQLAVDQKVNRCWPKFQILKSDVSALCSYFYSSQNPFPGLKIVNLLKKVPQISKPAWDPSTIFIQFSRQCHITFLKRNVIDLYGRGVSRDEFFYPRLSHHQKVWTLGFQMPCRTYVYGIYSIL